MVPKLTPTFGSQTSNMSRPSKSGVAALLVVVLLLFLVRRLSTPARTVVFLRTKPEALPSSDPADHSRTVRSRPLSSLPLQSALPPRPPQLRRPPPPPPCTKLECTTKLQTLEPDWVQLSSQPRIDWAGGGVRGDCLVGEYDYMMKSPYCTPPGLPTPTGKKWPSPERLEAADVHSQHLPQCGLAEIAALLPDRTFMLMGDSVMEQFYNALQCQLRREGLEKPPDLAFRSFIARNEPLWKMGKRKMPPKLPQQVRARPGPGPGPGPGPSPSPSPSPSPGPGPSPSPGPGPGPGPSPSPNPSFGLRPRTSPRPRPSLTTEPDHRA